MTRKDYRVIAKALSDSRPWGDMNDKSYAAWAVTVLSVTEALKAENPVFNATIFKNACGLGSHD